MIETTATTKKAIRQRGFSDAMSRRPSVPPADPTAAALYRNGYVTGTREREKRERGEVEA